MEHWGIPPPSPDRFHIHERVYMVGIFLGDDAGLAVIEGGPLRTGTGVTNWLVRPLGRSHPEWVPEWRLERA